MAQGHQNKSVEFFNILLPIYKTNCHNFPNNNARKTAMHQDPSQSAHQATLPTDIAEVDLHRMMIKRELRLHGVPGNLITSVMTRALRSGRRQTGEFQSNRDSRWTLNERDPQYGTEIDCKIIELRLFAMALQFDDAPTISPAVRSVLEERYIGEPIIPGTYRDSLLLERMNFDEFVLESTNPRHGSSNFHLGHEDPTLSPKHVPSNISWRSHRSNLIQGNMTLRESRIYFVRLIARYFELGEIHLS